MSPATNDVTFAEVNPRNPAVTLSRQILIWALPELSFIVHDAY